MPNATPDEVRAKHNAQAREYRSANSDRLNSTAREHRSAKIDTVRAVDRKSKKKHAAKHHADPVCQLRGYLHKAVSAEKNRLDGQQKVLA